MPSSFTHAETLARRWRGREIGTRCLESGLSENGARHPCDRGGPITTLESRCGRFVFGLAWMFAGGTSELGTMHCCSVQRTDMEGLPGARMNRRAAERCRDGDGPVGRQHTGTPIPRQVVAEFAA